MARARGDAETFELFDTERLFPVRAPRQMPPALDFNRRISVAMSEAIASSGKTRAEICALMSELLAYVDGGEVTVAQLNAYTSQARETHTISLVRWKAFVQATGCTWLWEIVLHDEGLTLLQGEEALLAQAALEEKQGRELLARAKQKRTAAPLQVQRRRGAK